MNITQATMNQMNEVFQKAYEQDRTMLFEHEVYEILAYAGMDIPKYDFVDRADQVTSDMLSGYSGEMMIKIVSRDIVHKQKVGGVQKIVPHDVYFVQYVIDKMEQKVREVLGDDTVIDGFLLVEAVEFSQSIGNEILYGISNDRAFGPVLTLSKGGSDAEFFAEYYDPANLYLPHFEYQDALELVSQLKVKHKYDAEGNGHYIESIAKAASLISALAYEYSPISDCPQPWHIESMDVNPFAFTKDGRFLALDGYLSFVKDSEITIPVANTDHLEKFFSPKSVCVLGISTKENHSNMASDIVELLMDLGWDDIYCINPKGGKTKIRDTEFILHESPENLDCDLYVYAAPAKNIPLFLKSIAHQEGKAVVLIPGLPSDVPYAVFKDQVRSILEDASIRIIGPNCMGVFSSSGEKHVNTLFIEKERLDVRASEYSNTALLSQSGGMAISLIDRFKHCPIMHSVVSFGNKYDVKITDLVPWFENDGDIDVIAIYVEGFEPLEGRLLFEQACQSKKPIIMYKSGKTEAGAAAASTHTAAMSGNYAVVEAMSKQSNIILCKSTNEFYNHQKAFALLSDRAVSGNRVSVICNAGFEATLAADECGDLAIAPMQNSTKEMLHQLDRLGLMGKSTAILDVTPMTDDLLYGKLIETMMDDNTVDCIVVGIIPHVDIIKATSDTCHDEDSLANIIARLYHKTKKPMVVSVNAGEVYKEFVKVMETAGVPVYDNIRDAMNSLDCFMNYHLK